jgi:signal transduction histidine kinase
VVLDVLPRGLAIDADRVRLEQCVSNLLTNALQAIGGKGRIELCARIDDGWTMLRVKDDGPGIDPAALPHLFEPFFSTKSEGAGLGLALVKRVAELHGGRVTVESRKGEGACFRLALPVHRNFITETVHA